MEKELTTKKVDEFLEIFKKGEEFTKDLLKENEKLRYRIAEMEDSLQGSAGEEKVRVFEERIKKLEDEVVAVKERYKRVEEENKDFAAKYIEVEEINNALANLYVASYQLHSTLDFDEVLRIIKEIVINLIGAEIFAVLLIDEKTNDIVPVSTEGVTLEAIPKARIGEGIVGSVAKEGESYFAADLREGGDVEKGMPMVCIALKIKEHVIGVIAIYSLLMQKEGFNNVDYELFNLLAGHAATAIFSAKLYTQSERKLTTIQSFLELLKEKPKK